MDRKYGWAPIGVMPHEYKSIKRSERWSILPVYTVDGFYFWDIIQGSYTKELFNEFVCTQVLPCCTPYPGPRSILVMDNARIHHSEVLRTARLCISCRFRNWSKCALTLKLISNTSSR